MHTYRSNIFASFRSNFKDCNLVISALYVRNILSITHRIVDFDYFFINIVMAPNLMEEIAKNPFILNPFKSFYVKTKLQESIVRLKHVRSYR